MWLFVLQTDRPERTLAGRPIVRTRYPGSLGSPPPLYSCKRYWIVRGADAEHLGRARRRAAGCLERLQDRDSARALPSSRPGSPACRSARDRRWRSRGEVLRRSMRRRCADDDGALDRVLQLAHVARPAVVRQPRQSVVGVKPSIVLPFSLRVADRGRLRRAAGMSSRRSRSGGSSSDDDVEPVVEILAEAALLRSRSSRSRLVAAITRTSTLIVCVAADALELALLEDAQQLGLDRRRDLADLVEEQRAAVGELEPAVLAPPIAPVNAPFSWPNSSLSSSDSASAAQWSLTNGPLGARASAGGSRARRAPCRCRSRR